MSPGRRRRVVRRRGWRRARRRRGLGAADGRRRLRPGRGCACRCRSRSRSCWGEVGSRSRRNRAWLLRLGLTTCELGRTLTLGGLRLSGRGWMLNISGLDRGDSRTEIYMVWIRRDGDGAWHGWTAEQQRTGECRLLHSGLLYLPLAFCLGF